MDINQTPVQHFEEEEFSFPLSPAEFLPQDLLLNPIAAPLPDPIQTALQPNQSALFHDLDISALLEPPVQLPLRDLTNVSSNGRSRQVSNYMCPNSFLFHLYFGLLTLCNIIFLRLIRLLVKKSFQSTRKESYAIDSLLRNPENANNSVRSNLKPKYPRLGRIIVN